MVVAGRVRVEGFRAVDDQRGELGVKGFEDGFGETGADVAYGFVGVGCAVVAGEEERAVDGSAFALAVVGAEDN